MVYERSIFEALFSGIVAAWIVTDNEQNKKKTKINC